MKGQMTPGVKFVAAQTGIATATGIAAGTIAKHQDIVSSAVDKFVKSGAGQKIAKSNTFTNLKEGAEKLVSAAKKNPKAAGAIAAVAGIGIAASTMLAFAHKGESAKLKANTRKE